MRSAHRFIQVLAGLVILTTSAAAHAVETAEVKKAAIQHVEDARATIDDVSQQIWSLAEIALQETRSSEVLASQLEKNGFTVTRGVAKLPTAFVATFGKGKPIIGILAEFDALAGVGNEPWPGRKARADGVTSGHGCGHNLFGSAAIGGAIALKKVIETYKLGGTLKVFGTPAEETLVGKVFMARAGLFDNADAVLDWHPGTKNRVSNATSRAMNNFEVEFFGQAAHGALDPWNGRSALDAVELMNHAANMMREHIPTSARMHYVIPEGGDAPNVVPERAKVWYFIRDETRPQVEKHYEWLLQIAEAAAKATQTRHKVRLITGAHSYLFNRPIQEALAANLQGIGAPNFTATDQKFGKALQKAAGKPEVGFRTQIEPLADRPEPPEGGSTDSAEVSRIAPTASFSIATAPEDVPWHSWATTASHGTEHGRKGAVVAAKLLAATGVDLLTTPDLLKRAAAFFKESTGGKPYVSPLK